MTTENLTENQAKNRDIEQLIYDIADHARDEDYRQLYIGLLHETLFIAVDPDSAASVPNAVHLGDIHSDDAARMQMCSVEGPRGDSFVPVATTPSSPMVAEGHHAEIAWLAALEMVLKTDTVDGVLLHGTNSWVCFYKPQLEKILQTYGKADSAQV